jgi:hypothetical protein
MTRLPKASPPATTESGRNLEPEPSPCEIDTPLRFRDQADPKKSGRFQTPVGDSLRFTYASRSRLLRRQPQRVD